MLIALYSVKAFGLLPLPRITSSRPGARISPGTVRRCDPSACCLWRPYRRDMKRRGHDRRGRPCCRHPSAPLRPGTRPHTPAPVRVCIRYIVENNILWLGTITPQHLDGNYSQNRCLANSCSSEDGYNYVTGEIAKTAAAGRPKEPPPHKFQVTRGTPLRPSTPLPPQPGNPLTPSPLSAPVTQFRQLDT